MRIKYSNDNAYFIHRMNTVTKMIEANIEIKKLGLKERESNIRSQSRLHLYMNNWSTHSHTYKCAHEAMFAYGV